MATQHQKPVKSSCRDCGRPIKIRGNPKKALRICQGCNDKNWRKP